MRRVNICPATHSIIRAILFNKMPIVSPRSFSPRGAIRLRRAIKVAATLILQRAEFARRPARSRGKKSGRRTREDAERNFARRKHRFCPGTLVSKSELCIRISQSPARARARVDTGSIVDTGHDIKREMSAESSVGRPSVVWFEPSGLISGPRTHTPRNFTATPLMSEREGRGENSVHRKLLANYHAFRVSEILRE